MAFADEADDDDVRLRKHVGVLAGITLGRPARPGYSSRMNPRDHWQRLYTKRRPTEVGWYERDPATSRRFVEMAVKNGAQSVVDIGGGASFLVDHLLDLGLRRVAVVDIAEASLAISQKRLGKRAKRVEWIVGDVTTIETIGRFDVWHDRAVFHFLLDPSERRYYVELSERTVKLGGTAVMATFAHNAPDVCSGLAVRHYGIETLSAECGPGWQLTHAESMVHRTPLGVAQPFLYSAFVRVASPN